MNQKKLAERESDEIGATFYVVDTDFRTPAQGWTQTDRSGPLDLWMERNPGRVFYTSGSAGGTTPYATDAAAIQAGLDAMVDYRNDQLILTPGSYSVGTVLALNVESGRVRGVRRTNPKANVVTVTGTVGNTMTVSTSNMEISNFRCVPLTATAFMSVGNAANYGHVHDVFYDSGGVAASTSTEFCNAAATTRDWLVERFSAYVDAAQGDAFTLDSPERWILQDSDFYVALNNIAWASVVTFTTSALGVIARRCTFRGCGGATPAVFTKIFTGIANVNGQLLITDCRVDGTALATATDIETTFGTTTDVELIENYQSGDATTEGGTLVKLA